MNTPDDKNIDIDMQSFLQSNRDVLDLLDRVGKAGSGQLPTPIGETVDLANETGRFPVANNDPGAADLPQRIGRFEIKSLLGQGGYGIVFLADDPKLKRQVALKVPRPETILTEELRVRFIREAELAASLSHSNIVPVLEAGSAGPVCYIVTGYFPGVTLSRWCELSGRVSSNLAARMLITLTDAVQHAHSRDVIHRDLKPDNILVSSSQAGSSGADRSDAMADVRITDFGLARSQTETAEITRSGCVIGTPAYMAPEQINPDFGPVGPESDIYSLGAILYFLLCGKPPLVGSSLMDTIRQVESETPSSIRSLRRDVPLELEAICLKCLQKNPRQRYQSASELQADLLRFVNGLPVLARTPTWVDHALLWCRRRPAVAALTAALFLVLAVSTVVLAMALSRVSTLKQISDSHAASAVAERDRARNALDTMTSPAAVDWLTSRKTLTDEQRRFLEETADQYRELTAQPNAQGQSTELDLSTREWVAMAKSKLANMVSRLGDKDDALILANEAVQEYLRLTDDFPDEIGFRFDLAEAMQGYVNLLLQSRKLETAEPLTQQWLAVADQLVQANPERGEFRATQAAANNTLATILALQQQAQPAIELRKLAIQQRRDLVRDDPENPDYLNDLALSLNNQSFAFLIVGDVDEGIKLQQESLQIKEQLAELEPGNFQFQDNLATSYVQMASIVLQTQGPAGGQDVETYAQKALEIRAKLARDYPLNVDLQKSYVGFHFDFGVFMNQLGRYELAVSTCRTGLAALQKIGFLFSDSTGVDFLESIGQLTLGNALSGDGDYEQAVQAYTAAATILEPMFEAGSSPAEVQSNLLYTYWDRATALAKIERFKEAIASWDRAIALAGANDQDKLKVARATTLVRWGKLTQARDETDALTGDTQTNPSVFYNAACVYALMAEQAKDDDEAGMLASNAIRLLRRSQEKGYQRIERWKEDDELAILHDRDDFHALFDAD